MTRIIQPRCFFLVLAFTGVLLSTAQETTVSDESHAAPKSREGTSSSALENSSVTIGPPPFSSRSPVDNKEAESSSSHPAAVSSSVPDATGDATDNTSSKISNSNASESLDDTAIESETTERNDEEHGSTSPNSVSHSEGLFKAELQDAEFNASEIASENSSESLNKSLTDNESTKQAPEERLDNASERNTTDARNEIARVESETTPEVSAHPEGGETTEAAAFQSAEASSSENNINDSEQTSVPLKEEQVYSSSKVDQTQSPEEMSSTAPSKVQTEENGFSDSVNKSATRKRSLNATNTATSTTTTDVPSSGQTSSSTPDSALLKHTVPASLASNSESTGVEESTEVLTTVKQLVPAETTSDTEHTGIENVAVTREVPNHGHTVNSAEPSTGASVAHFHESDHVAELASSDAHVPPISSAALSTLSEESIQPFEKISTTAQTLNEERSVSTAFLNPDKSPELEVEPAILSSHSYPLVTFDPDGLTNNFSQDPDSVTFTPETFHVDGTDKYLSRLENDESLEKKQAEIERETFTTVLDGNSSEREGHHFFDPERETESSLPPGHALFPHDEPDMEKVSSASVSPSTKVSAEVGSYSTSGLTDAHTFGPPDASKPAILVNAESEEMLNDSPHFVQIQSKSTAVPTSDVRNEFVSKDLENNLSNDISSATGSSPHTTVGTVTKELEILTEYHTEQSEIRPVTAASPLKISTESTTLLPVSVDSFSTPDSAKSGQPDNVLPDTSSPIILPNPAPAVTNQRAEATTIVMLQPIIPISYGNDSLTDKERESDDATLMNATSTIRVAVKTSVSVSLPLSNIQNETMTTVVQDKTDASAPSNGSEVILPLPIPVNKDADGHPAPTLAPTTLSTSPPAPSTTESRGYRIKKPKIRGDAENSSGPSTRKPFLTSLKRPSTTAGPQVSIFNKPRTGGASITSSTTARPLSNVRIHYASRFPPGLLPANWSGGELVFSTEPITTTVPPTTTETEEPFSDEPFTEQTQGPIVPSEDNVQLTKVAGYIVFEKGLRWSNQLNDRLSPEYKMKARYVQMQLDHLFRTSTIATQLWKIKIDGFSVIKPRSVAVDFFLLLIKNESNEITDELLTAVFHDKLKNNTFSRFTVDTNKTTFERLNDEPLNPTTLPPEEEEEPEPVIPQWAIAVIVVGAASLIFIVLFAAVAILGRHHMRRRYTSKLNDEDSDRPSDWESKMAAAYENLAADTIYEAEDMHSDTYKKRHHNATFHGRPSRPTRADSWSSSDWSPPPRRPRPQVHRIVC